MPRRNFYIKGIIDGRKNNVTGGPLARDGGMIVILTQRDNRSIKEVCDIRSYTFGDDLITAIWADGKKIYEVRTRR